MGEMNLLKASWTGKVGQTVGAKWKDKNTIRTYTKPAYTNTPQQQVIRANFGAMSSFVAQFADQIKSLSALDTKGMSVRNAIIELNREQIPEGTFDPTQLKISRGGLPPVTMTYDYAGTPEGIELAWNAVISPTISLKAKVVVVVVNLTRKLCVVGSYLNTLQNTYLPADGWFIADQKIGYAYVLDYRGSSKVASVSTAKPFTQIG